MAEAVYTTPSHIVHGACPRVAPDAAIGPVMASLFRGWRSMYDEIYGPRAKDVPDTRVASYFEIEDAISAQQVRSIRDLAVKIVIADSDGLLTEGNSFSARLVAEARRILK